MRKFKNIPFLLFISLLQGSLKPLACDGFEIRTHETISDLATQASNLNNYLTTVLQFEFPGGIGESLSGKPVFRLIQDGSMNEDSPFTRTRAHFHDPTKAWAQAGLGQTFESSILWSQNPNQVLGGKHSWQDARNSYFNALTSTDPTQRKKYYAETFETLGHLIHHVQDAAVPAHTRNDVHIGGFVGQGYGFPIGDPDRFHHWANTVGASQIGGNQPFDPSILIQTYNGLVPIAGIIDTTTTAGPATPSAATNIGIAEYSNANFFSDDTILTTDYAYPNITQMELSQEAGPDGPEKRSYLRKSFAPGPIDYRAAVSTSLIDKLPVNFPTQQLELDDNVMADYGGLLFPRAIGYSAGLIDYFFRGKIDLLPTSSQPSPASMPPTTITPSIANVTPDENTGNGILRLVLQYAGQFNTSESFPQIVVSNAISQNVTRSFQNATFPFSSLPFPATMGPTCFPEQQFICYSLVGYNVLLVYRGPLGMEDDSVIVSTCSLAFNRLLYTFGELVAVGFTCFDS